ncbi:MAG: pyridoxine 5'-phosphate synthase [bacterium]
MARLGVNIDHIATLRQVRKTLYPDLALAARMAEEGGADQITCHLREDRRHIQDEDVRLLRRINKTKLNLEMAATVEMVSIALEVKPDIVTLVPEKRQELTTEGGLNLAENFESLKKTVGDLKAGGIPVSLFINPDREDLQRSRYLGVEAVELHTGQYAEAKNPQEAEKELQRIAEAARFGSELKLKVYAGHGLHYDNVSPLVDLPEIEEYNIGHSIVARAVFVGIGEAVREMKALLRGPS